MSCMNLTVKLLSEKAKIPTRKSPTSAGYDITLSESAFLEPDEIKELTIGLGLFMQQKDFSVIILQKRNVFLKYSTQVIEGIIDTDHQEELLIVAKNLSHEPVCIPEGTAIGELLFVNVSHPVITEVLYTPIAITKSEKDSASSSFG